MTSASARPATSFHQDEEGVMTVFAGITLILALFSMVLAIDLGSHALAERDIQGAVDLAALDAATAFGDYTNDDPVARATELAEASLARNDGYSSRANRTVTVETGIFDDATRSFTPTSVGMNAVMVTATGQLDRIVGIIPGTDTIEHSAIAELIPLSSISIGTNVASFDTARSQVLGTALSAMLGGPTSLDVVGFQGLANGTVRLGDIQAQLGLGSVDELLDVRVTAGQLLTAAANGLSATGDPLDATAAGVLFNIAANIGNQTIFKVGDILKVESGTPGQLGAVDVDALSLVTGVATVINAGNVIDLGIDLAGIPGVTSGIVKMAVIEPAQIAVGRPGMNASGQYRTVAQTANVRFGLDLVMDPLGNFAGVSVGAMSLPLGIDAGYGEAALASVTCASTQGAMSAVNRVTTSGARVAYGANKSASLLQPAGTTMASVNGPLVTLSVNGGALGNVPIASVGAQGIFELPGGTGDVTLPGTFPSRATFSGNSPFSQLNGVGLSSIIADLNLNTTILGAAPSAGLGVSIGGAGAGVDLTNDVLAPALQAVAGTLDTIDQQIFGTLLDGLGMVAIADAETAALAVDCGSRRLVR